MRKIKKPKYDVAIVLGAAVDPKGNLANFVKNRLDKAIEVYRKRETNTILTTGGITNLEDKDAFQISESETMTKYLIEREVPKQDIIGESESRNTIQNAYFSRVIHTDHMYASRDSLNAKRPLIITSEFHMPRSIGNFNWVLGPNYKPDYESVSNPPDIDPKDIETREIRENKLNKFYKDNLYNNIAPGDLAKIHSFIFNPHGKDKYANQYKKFLKELNKKKPTLY